jgi:hypothetical protein
MIKRCDPKAPPLCAFTLLEVKMLDKLVKDRSSEVKMNTIENYIIKIAKLGGYLARASDPPPGNR